MLQSSLISAAMFYVFSGLNGIELLETFPSPAMVIGFLVLCVVVLTCFLVFRPMWSSAIRINRW